MSSEIRALRSGLKWRSNSDGGQLQSSLESLHTQLFIQTRLYAQKNIHIKESQMKYWAAWAALKGMVGLDFIGYPELKEEHCMLFTDPDTKAVRNVRRAVKKARKEGGDLIGPGESRKVVSWIWTGVDVSDGSPAMMDALRVEWCKARARACRWQEELQMLETEMERTVLSLEQEALEWGTRVPEADVVSEEGGRAYCMRQAAIRRGLAAKFTHLWALPDPPPRTSKRAVQEVELEGNDTTDSESDA
ncbi:hypothetical protein V5O48_017678 [Marasmius crinis-equi]|uniref:Uncharacterized protein n=1 Tax=Marasmius crinis-equi TaxID=585013 RepID=A0ABR3ENA7_9AGAR